MSVVHIKVENVTLDYKIYEHSTLSFKKTLVSLATAGAITKNNKGIIKVRSLANIDLSLKPGDKLGLIGGNGAGKTSLLKLLAGIYEPTIGHVESRGKITTLLGTGFGLDDEASGYQNILLGGIALGYSMKEMKECSDNIAEFTELGDFLNMPLRTYSAGMRARLAFAIATCKRPDILLIDEGIGAGDTSFYEKANKRLEAFLGNASILVLASHSDSLIKRFCNKCLYLNHGKIEYFGDLDKGLKLYNAVNKS